MTVAPGASLELADFSADRSPVLPSVMSLSFINGVPVGSVAEMSWFGEPKDLIAIVIATLAFILSVVTLLSQRWQQQRDAYREVYDVLMSPDLHEGRWLIVDIGEGAKKVPDRGSPEFLLIYRTLGVFSALATYTQHGIIPRDLVLKVWRHALLDMKQGAEIISDGEIDRHKGSRGKDWKPWPDLWELYEGL